MKKFISVILMALMCFAHVQADDLENEVNIVCEYGRHLKLTLLSNEELGDALHGQLVDNYNGAGIVCRNRGWDQLKRLNIPLACTGIWNHAMRVGADGNPTSLNNHAVSITILKDNGDKYVARYVNDAYETFNRDLPCSIQ